MTSSFWSISALCTMYKTHFMQRRIKSHGDRVEMSLSVNWICYYSSSHSNNKHCDSWGAEELYLFSRQKKIKEWPEGKVCDCGIVLWGKMRVFSLSCPIYAWVMHTEVPPFRQCSEYRLSLNCVMTHFRTQHVKLIVFLKAFFFAYLHEVFSGPGPHVLNDDIKVKERLLHARVLQQRTNLLK